MSRNFLLEVGCEELPSEDLPGVLDWEREGPRAAGGLASSAVSVLSDKNAVWKSVQSFATPRRLVLLIRGLEEKVCREEKGPPVSVAYDAQGRPTRAAEAFARRHGLPVSRLTRKQTPKAEVVVARYSLAVTEVLAQAVPQMIEGMVFPKTMRWDDSGARFARPVRWLLCLFGKKVIACSFGRVKAGNKTCLTRRAEDKPVPVTSVDRYFGLMKKERIQLEQGIRITPGKEPFTHLFKEQVPLKKERLQKALEAKAKALSGRLYPAASAEFEWLLSTATFLAEDPVVREGSFEAKYLALPPEVLAASMAKHLKLFSVYAADGKRLLPKFLAVLEGRPGKPATVTANLERIIEARFSDASFFYEEDTRQPLEAKVEQLRGVVFHEKLGTVYERIPRIEKLLAVILEGSSLSRGLGVPLLARMARLCKADLVTQMVREFPSLQGVVGGYYAKQSGESEWVSRAIGEHYRPKSFSDPLPGTPLGSWLSLADRLDALTGYFGVGLKPTGSADPYALRRAALGAVRILTDEREAFSLTGLSVDSLIRAGIESWGSRLTLPAQVVQEELQAFLKERWLWLAGQAHPGAGGQWLDAVWSPNPGDLIGAWRRLEMLLGFLKNPKSRETVLRAAKVAERSGRMVRAASGEEVRGSVDASLFQEPVEKELWRQWQELSPVLSGQLARSEYLAALASYGRLREPLHAYFEKVFVMGSDQAQRINRLLFLKEIHTAMAGHFADLSEVAQDA
ncbi:MAG: glycine--tRNA ligase subunit beta [Candidatus Omnitrophica bacterium]|nr:glycine--tRNA ligase subunit beta [Candidatus Omnitrophota bacterium]